MLKSYDELRKVDVLPFCDMREAKDDHGARIQVPYLNWAKCIDLLHLHGAKEVWFEPVVGQNGSSLIMADQVFTDSKQNTNRCYEVRVRIHIDSMEWEAQFPLMNGSNPVKDNSLTQQRLWNAQTRAFVKGVALRTGLGFNLWLDSSEDEGPKEDDLSYHNILAIKTRVQQKYTKLIQRGMSTRDIADKIGASEDTVRVLFAQYDQLNRFEKDLERL